MKKEEKKYNVTPTDQMIQSNKEESDSMLRVWGKKERRHILPNNKRPK